LLQPRPTVRLGDYYGPEPRKLATEAIENLAHSPSLEPNAAGRIGSLASRFCFSAPRRAGICGQLNLR